MKSAQPGEEVLLCTRARHQLLKHAVAIVGAAARVESTTPSEVVALYGATNGRMFVQLSDVRMHPETPVVELSCDEQAVFASGQAYVKRLKPDSSSQVARSRPPLIRDSFADSPEALPPHHTTVAASVERRGAVCMPCVVVGVDPTAGLWNTGMTLGKKRMPSVALHISADGAIAMHRPAVQWHMSNQELWNCVDGLGAAVTCIDGPCDTNGLKLASDWSYWDLGCRGTARAGERALSKQGVGLFWTTHATITGFDGASRWIARSLRLFHENQTAASPREVIETHPHGAFRFLRLAISGSAELTDKRSQEGRDERLETLSAFINDLHDSDLPNHDAVDAACAALVAALHRLGRTASFGTVQDGGEIWMPALRLRE
jgi:predicted nuclease with RNAse H fold